MKLSNSWLQELVELKITLPELVELIPFRVQGGIKEADENSIELDLKGYNRADLLSMRGVAYEVAAITGSKVLFSEPDESKYYWIDKMLPKLNVTVEDENDSPFYCLVKIDGLKVEQSSKEIQQKLADCGMRSVNNVADITNLIMLEYGQPMHAFDLSTIKDESIIVRKAKNGEQLTTLDGKTRQLEEGDIMIADPEKAVGLAGVMGGQNSEIRDNTGSILLEAAIFDPVQLRKTATRLNLVSEAGKRFYHGLTKKRLLQALNAAISEYTRIGGRVNGIAITGTSVEVQKQIPLSLNKVNSLIGAPITTAQVEKFLQSLNFGLVPQKDAEGRDGWIVTPPYYRLDIEIEEDVVEEIARLYGYEKIPAQPLPAEMPEKIDQSQFEKISQIKNELVNLGLTEVQSYSFYSTAVLDALGWDEYRRKMLLKLANPMSAETEYMRQTIWANLAEIAVKNVKHGLKEIQIFEIGKVYRLNEDLTFNEYYSLGIAVVGEGDAALKTLHQKIVQLMKKLGLNMSVKQGLGELPVELYHPLRQYQLQINEKPVGGIAEIHPRVLFKLGLDGKRVAVAEFPLSVLNFKTESAIL